MPIENLVQMIFQIAVTSVSGIGIKFLYDLKKSINELNVKVAVVIEKVSNHEKQIDEHAERISSLEKH
jgi:hypothetical protein